EGGHLLLNTGQRSAVGKCTLESSVVLRGLLPQMSGDIRRERTATQGETDLLRSIGEQSIGNRTREGIVKDSKSAANHRSLQTKWIPRKTKPSLQLVLRVFRKRLVRPEGDGLVVGLIGGVGLGEESCGHSR